MWPQREAFKIALERYMDEHGKTHQDMADLLGVSRDHLRNCIYRKAKRLGIDVIQKAAALFGRPVREFIDDAASPVPGIEGEATDRLTVAKRAALLRMYQNLSHDSVSDEDALKALDILDALFKAGKIRKPKF